MKIDGSFSPTMFGIQIGCAMVVVVALIALILIFIKERKQKKTKTHSESRRIEVDIDMEAVYVINGKRWRIGEMSMVQSGMYHEERLTLTLDRVGE